MKIKEISFWIAALITWILIITLGVYGMLNISWWIILLPVWIFLFIWMVALIILYIIDNDNFLNGK